MALYNEWGIMYSKSLDLNNLNNWTLEISYLRIMMIMMTEGWSSLIAGHHPSSLDTVEWHTIPETNKTAQPDIWKTSAGLNAARDATERRFNGLRCDQYRVLCYTCQCWGFLHQGRSQTGATWSACCYPVPSCITTFGYTDFW